MLFTGIAKSHTFDDGIFGQISEEIFQIQGDQKRMQEMFDDDVKNNAASMLESMS